MKKKLKLLILTAFLISAPLLLLAQQPPHPNGGAGPGTGNGPVGGGAPIGGGIGILLALGATYGFRKLKSSDEQV